MTGGQDDDGDFGGGRGEDPKIRRFSDRAGRESAPRHPVDPRPLTEPSPRLGTPSGSQPPPREPSLFADPPAPAGDAGPGNGHGESAAPREPREPRLTRPTQARAIPLRANRDRPSSAPPTGGLFARQTPGDTPPAEPRIGATKPPPPPTPPTTEAPPPVATPPSVEASKPTPPRPRARPTELRAVTPTRVEATRAPQPKPPTPEQRPAARPPEEPRAAPPRAERPQARKPEAPKPQAEQPPARPRVAPPKIAQDLSELPEPPRPRLREAAPPARETAPPREAATTAPAPSEPDRRQGAERRAERPTATVATLPPKAAEPVSPKPVLVARNEGLVVQSIGKQFKKRPVLRDISLRVQRGEAVGLLGPNGAGKTTCFYIITGLIPADFGEIMLDGVDITDLPMYRRSRLGIGYLPQESSIFRGLTVEQNIMAVLELIDKDRESRETTLEALLAEFSITHLRRTPAVALSGGERRRLEIARALASQPNFVLLDEPLAGIDPIAVRDIRELVSHLKDRGIGVLITDHNVRETLDIVDRAYILHDGNVLMEGAPNEIVANQEVRRVYLGDRFSL